MWLLDRSGKALLWLLGQRGDAEEKVSEDGSFLISGWMPALEFAELLKISLPSSRQYQTCAGFVLHEFGAIPNVGDRIESHDWQFEIVDLDGRRIDKVLATPLRNQMASKA